MESERTPDLYVRSFTTQQEIDVINDDYVLYQQFCFAENNLELERVELFDEYGIYEPLDEEDCEC